MAVGHFIDRHFGFCSGNGVQFGHKIGYPSLLQYGLDVFVVILTAYERQQLVAWNILVLFYYGHSDCIERHDNGLSPLFDGLRRYIFNRSIDYIPLLQAKEVSNATADIALKHEYIPQDFQLLIIREVSPVSNFVFIAVSILVLINV